MKSCLLKTVVGACLLAFVFLLVTPAQAARTGGSTYYIVPSPKPVVSAY